MSITEHLRNICLALPEAVEKQAWGDPTWRVHDRIFAMEKRGDGRISAWCKAPPGSQEILTGADPQRYFVPPYVGHRGWIGIRLDDAPTGRRSLRCCGAATASSRRGGLPRASTRPSDDCFQWLRLRGTL